MADFNVIVTESNNKINVINDQDIIILQSGLPNSIIISQVGAQGPAGTTDHGSLTGLLDDDHTQYFNSSRADTWLATKSTSNLVEGSNLYFTNERVDDRVSSLLVAGSNITLTYDDNANTLTIDSTGGGGGGITSINGLTGSTQTFAVGTSASSFAPYWQSTGTTHTIHIPDATNSVRGLVNSTIQDFYGRKRFSNESVDGDVSLKNTVEGSISTNNTVDSSSDFVAGVWGSAESGSAFDTGQLIGTLGFAGSGTNSGDISSLTGLYGWAQSHSAFSGALGYLYGNYNIARHLAPYSGTSVIGSYNRVITEIANTVSGVGLEVSIQEDGVGEFDVSYGVRISNLDGSIKYGVHADIVGSSNIFHEIQTRNNALIQMWDANNSNYVGLRSSPTQTSDYVISFPAASPGDNTFLKHTTGGTYTWASGGSVTIGTIDSETPSANGAVINGSSQLVLQSASQTNPGLLNTASGGQELFGSKEFIRDLVNPATNFFGVTGSINVANTANSSAAPNLAGVIGAVAKTDNFNQTGIAGIFSGGQFYATNVGNGSFTTSNIYGSISAGGNSGSGNVTYLYGSLDSASNTGTGTVTHLIGNSSNVSGTVGSTITEAMAYNADVFTAGTGTDGYGFRLQNGSISGFTNMYGISIEDAAAKSVFVGGIYGSKGGGDLILGSTTDVSKTNVIIENGSTFRLAATLPTNQSYDFYRSNSNSLDIQGQKSGAGGLYRFFSKDGDGTDFTAWQLFGLGTPSSVINSESLSMGWDQTNGYYAIASLASGTGTIRSLRLYTGTDTNQLTIQSNGDVLIQSWASFDNSTQTLFIGDLYFDGPNNQIVSSSGNISVSPNNSQLEIHGYYIQNYSITGVNSQIVAPLGNSSNSDLELSANLTDSSYIRNLSYFNIDVSNSGFDINSNDTIGQVGMLNGVVNAGSGTYNLTTAAAFTNENVDNGATVTEGRGIINLASAANSGTTTTFKAFVAMSEVDSGTSGSIGSYIAYTSEQWGDSCDNFYLLFLDSGVVTAGTDFYFLKNDEANAKSYLAGSLQVDGNLGFFSTTPVAQQTSSGAVTAGATYTATEQTMIQEMYDALRAYGLLS